MMKENPPICASESPRTRRCASQAGEERPGSHTGELANQTTSEDHDRAPVLGNRARLDGHPDRHEEDGGEHVAERPTSGSTRRRPRPRYERAGEERSEGDGVAGSVRQQGQAEAESDARHQRRLVPPEAHHPANPAGHDSQSNDDDSARK
jgi:hypothetical protein